VSRGFITAAKEGTVLNLRVSPGAKRNAEVERFLAELLDVPRSDVAVIHGPTSRDKKVLVHGLAPAQTKKALSAHLP
jgi:uncharacterized protein YggU (UPF0235/DUF167 family)